MFKLGHLHYRNTAPIKRNTIILYPSAKRILKVDFVRAILLYSNMKQLLAQIKFLCQLIAKEFPINSAWIADKA